MFPPQETEIKLAILKRYLPLLAAVPYTRLVFLSGSVAAGTARPESDIDLIIVSQKNRLWLNRILLETAAWLVGHRRSRTKFKNRFCFNMFLADDQPLLPHQDSVAAGCYKNLKPVWSVDDKQLKNFWQTNRWLEKYGVLSTCRVSNPQHGRSISTFTVAADFVVQGARFALEKLLDWSGLGFLLEKISFGLQYAYLKNRFNACGGYRNPQADFFVKPNLIAYHFPVSHHHRATMERFLLDS
ncbi:MAG: nucleotidyltransferase domain-containing protein [Patescibacteria group bacterium]